MKKDAFQSHGLLRKLCLVCVLAVIVAGALGRCPAYAAALAPRWASAGDAIATTEDYVVAFYPLWFSYNQARVVARAGLTNAMGASARVSPLYHFVVAINYDTVYSGIYLNLSTEPVIVTIPPTTVGYSILVLDTYGNQIPTGIPAHTPGLYAFTGPGFSGALPKDVKRIAMPIDFPTFFIRAVKFSPTGAKQTDKAEAFLAALKTQTLRNYLSNPSAGATRFLPESFFAVPFKTFADELIARKPIAFLKQLQQAVAAPNTPPLSRSAQKLADHFNKLFGNGNTHVAEFSAGTRRAHAAIVFNYFSHTDQKNWIHFTNIADWGNAFLDRSSITEFLQLSNAISTAAYYHAFLDGGDQRLDGSNPRGYVLRFRAGHLPAAKLFWSLTAYTPDAIELVPNPANKYVVASYTPALKYDSDGSLSVYMATRRPAGAPVANWLPVPPGRFNIMLRVYGPAGDVADNTYVPPGIQKR